MSDPARRYAEDGSFADGMCECGAHSYRNGRWFSRDGEDAEWIVRMTTYVGCACHVCGSYLFPNGTATPGVEVLWFLLQIMEESRYLTRDARQWHLAEARARASLAARKETPHAG
jgi:hypothetical protein